MQETLQNYARISAFSNYNKVKVESLPIEQYVGSSYQVVSPFVMAHASSRSSNSLTICNHNASSSFSIVPEQHPADYSTLLSHLSSCSSSTVGDNHLSLATFNRESVVSALVRKGHQQQQLQVQSQQQSDRSL
ncbi:hypothetical protein BsWGS_26325 [Bradybaena similaris]